MADHRPVRHRKWHGFVDWIEDECWVGRIDFEGRDLWVWMDKKDYPIPVGMGSGHLFAIHTPKRGRAYVYWITRGYSASKRKRIGKAARVWAKQMRKLLDDHMDPTLG